MLSFLGLSEGARRARIARIDAFARRVYDTMTLRDDAGPRKLNAVGLAEEEALYLEALAVKCGAKRTVETGLGLGLSTLALVRAGLKNGASGVFHSALDPMQPGPDFRNVGLYTLRDSGAAAHVRHISKDSAIGLAALLDRGESFDLAFIDGSHLFDWVMIDLCLCARLVRPGGWIILDDIYLPAVQSAMDFAAGNWGAAWGRPGQIEGLPSASARIVHRMAIARVPEHWNRIGVHGRKWDHFAPFRTEWERGEGRPKPSKEGVTSQQAVFES